MEKPLNLLLHCAVNLKLLLKKCSLLGKRKKKKTLKKAWKKQNDLFNCMQLIMSRVGKTQQIFWTLSSFQLMSVIPSLGKSSTFQKTKKKNHLWFIMKKQMQRTKERPALLTRAALGPRLQPQVQPVPGHVPQPAAGGRREPDPCRQPELRAAAGAPHPERGRRYRNVHGQTSFRGIPGNQKQQARDDCTRMETRWWKKRTWPRGPLFFSQAPESSHCPRKKKTAVNLS